MSIDWWTLGLQAFNVGLLIWLLSRFLFKPVVAIVSERQQAAARLLAQAAAERQAAEAEQQAAAAEHQAMLAQREQLLLEAEQAAAARRGQLIAEAEREAAALARERQRSEQHELALLRQQLEQQAGQLALEISRRLLQRLPELAINDFLAGLCRALETLPELERMAFSRLPLTLRSARVLSSEERELCIAALQQVLGERPELQLEVQPQLLAGLELDNGQTVLRNHLAADLARLQQELAL